MTDSEIRELLHTENDELFKRADKIRREIFGDLVYIRGLIEISSFCKNDCLYCGIRASNTNAKRYRLEKEEILQAVKNGSKLGFSTFVLQGGEDLYFTDAVLCDIIENIKGIAPSSAVTLSLGERSAQSYKRLKDAGADRYLLRHETADAMHYAKLHNCKMDIENRKRCLYDLKALGYQTGSGFMVGSPYQTEENIIADISFLSELQPDMIGIGPFISHRDTPFKDFENGSAELTLKLIAILRILFPESLIPATTALATLSADGRERGLKAGANVVMPNLSPEKARAGYNLYDNKLSCGAESAEGLEILEKRIKSVGYTLSMGRGDSPRFLKEKE